MCLPYLSYHLTSAEICLFSPQTYHTLYGGHNTGFGDWVVMMIDNSSIKIPTNGEAGNVPMIYESSYSAAEVKKIGPLNRSALHHYEKKVDMIGNYVSNIISNDDNGVPIFVNQFGLQGRDVNLQANKNMSGAQKELMILHLKLGASMSHV